MSEETKPAENTHTSASSPAPNIRFVSKTEQPLTLINHSTQTIVLPETEAEQRAGFYHKDAEFIVKLLAFGGRPGLYKLITAKG